MAEFHPPSLMQARTSLAAEQLQFAAGQFNLNPSKKDKNSLVGPVLQKSHCTRRALYGPQPVEIFDLSAPSIIGAMAKVLLG